MDVNVMTRVMTSAGAKAEEADDADPARVIEKALQCGLQDAVDVSTLVERDAWGSSPLCTLSWLMQTRWSDVIAARVSMQEQQQQHNGGGDMQCWSGVLELRCSDIMMLKRLRTVRERLVAVLSGGVLQVVCHAHDGAGAGAGEVCDVKRCDNESNNNNNNVIAINDDDDWIGIP